MLQSTFKKKLSLSDSLQSVVAQSSGGGSIKMMGVPKDVLLAVSLKRLQVAERL